MGQYYKPVIMSPDGRIMTISSRTFDSGSKLIEHSWVGNYFVNSVYSLAHRSPKQVAWIGDYSSDPYDADSDAYAKALPYDKFMELYSLVWDDDREDLPKKLFSNKDMDILTEPTTGMYLLNHSKHTYVDMTRYLQENTVKSGDDEGWCTSPLPLLTACGNNRGGGDFHENHTGYENIGIWAFDSIEYSNRVPPEYAETPFIFIED